MRRNEQTALVTGPTSGIGAAFAEILARQGYRLILVSRSKDELEVICRRLAEKYGVGTHYITADLSQRGEPERVFEKMQSMNFDLDLLVNNAGTHEYGPFSQSDWDAIQALIELNVQSVVRLTHLFLPGMVARDRGHILNLGSTGSFIPWPNDAIYGAGKAFILRFSEALSEELKDTGVRVTCLCPGVVETAFVEKGDLDQTILSRLTAMQPEPVVRQGVRAINTGKWVQVPGLVNKLIVFFHRFVPRQILTRLAKWATTPSGYRND